MLQVQGLGPRKAEAPLSGREKTQRALPFGLVRPRTAWRRLPTLGRATRLSRSPIRTLTSSRNTLPDTPRVLSWVSGRPVRSEVYVSEPTAPTATLQSRY